MISSKAIIASERYRAERGTQSQETFVSSLQRKVVRRRVLVLGCKYVVLCAFAVFTLFPIYWIVSTSFKSQVQLFAFTPVWFPHPPTLGNYQQLFEENPIRSFAINSGIMTAAVVLGQLIVGVPAAYSFARLRYRGRDRLFLAFLCSLMVPPLVVMVPLFVLLREIHWVSTWQGLIVPQVFSFGIPTIVVFFLRQFFLTLPRELEEAAAVDGASVLRTLWTVILPNATPAVVTVGSIALVSTWNSFLWPLLIVSSESRYTLTVGMGTLIGEYLNANWGSIMGGAAILMLPMVVFFVVTQRHFLRSLVLSGLK